MTPSIGTVWQRIKVHEGEAFSTITGMRFTYSVVGDVLRTDRAKQNLSRSNFEKVLPLLPLPGPGQISNEVRGPAYVWAILHDKRI
jgi:hypothetical protein